MEPINLLITLNQNYIPQLRVLLTSLFINNPDEIFSLYLLHSGLDQETIDSLQKFCQRYGYVLTAVYVEDTLFHQAPMTRQYPKEMYYRLLAAELLPESLDRILYLDPDILVINSIRPLWELDMRGNLFAAAAHNGQTRLLSNVNQLRLGTEHDYYNSGVLLIDLKLARQKIQPQAIFQYVEKHRKELILPDQDILNAMYGRWILALDDVIWNYDARRYSSYLFCSGGVYDVAWVMKNTVIIHFCGKEKPWNAKYSHRFGVLYQHYVQIVRRMETSLMQIEDDMGTLIEVK